MLAIFEIGMWINDNDKFELYMIHSQKHTKYVDVFIIWFALNYAFFFSRNKCPQ